MAHYPPLVPSFAVSDPRASIAWFEKLGFTSRGEATMPDGSIMHAELAKGDAVVMLGPCMDGGLGSPGGYIYVPLESGIDEYYASVKGAGVSIVEDIQDQFWGDRTFMVAHPDGYKFMFAQKVREVSMEESQAALAQFASAPA